MKNLILLLLLAIAITACHNSSQNQQKFGQIKPGMKSKAVIALVGNPETKTPMFIAEWWSYTSDNKMIIMANDTVVRIVLDLKATQDSMKTLGFMMKQKTDSLNNTISKPDSTK